MNPANIGTNWLDDFKVGSLTVFIDDMELPVMVIPLNLGYTGGLDDFSTPNPVTLD